MFRVFGIRWIYHISTKQKVLDGDLKATHHRAKPLLLVVISAHIIVRSLSNEVDSSSRGRIPDWARFSTIINHSHYHSSCNPWESLECLQDDYCNEQQDLSTTAGTTVVCHHTAVGWSHMRFNSHRELWTKHQQEMTRQRRLANGDSNVQVLWIELEVWPRANTIAMP